MNKIGLGVFSGVFHAIVFTINIISIIISGTYKMSQKSLVLFSQAYIHPAAV
jgi:hypothetical protein